MKLVPSVVSSKVTQLTSSLGDLIVKHGALKSYTGSQADDVDNINIPDLGVHFYIGNLAENDTGFYNKDFINNSLDSLFSKLPRDSDIHIEMGGSVGQLLNPSVVVSDMQDQLDQVEQWATSRPKKQARRVYVHNLEDKHKYLFDCVRQNGIEGLGEEFDESKGSLYLASLLYKAIASDPRFGSRISNTKPAGLKQTQENGEGDHYATMELAIRMQDLLDGISLQGGEARQQMYDAIILDILNGQYNNSEKAKYKPVAELQELNRLLKDYSNKFQRVYFSKDKYELVQAEASSNKLIRGLILGLGCSGLLLIMQYYNAIENEREQRRQEVEYLVEGHVNGQALVNVTGLGSVVLAEDGEELQVLKWKAERVIQDFKKIYGNGNLSDEQLSDMVFQQFLRMEIKNIPAMDINSLSGMSSFIENYFIPENSIRLIKEGKIDIFRQKYVEQYGDVYFSEKSGIPRGLVDMDTEGSFVYTTSDLQKYKMANIDCSSVDPHAGVQFRCDEDDIDERLVAKSTSSKHYNFEDAKEVAYDYLNNIIVKQFAWDIRTILRSVYNVWSEDMNNDHDYLNKQLIRMLYNRDVNIKELHKRDPLYIINFIESHFESILSEGQVFTNILDDTLSLEVSDINNIIDTQGKLGASYLGLISVGGLSSGINLYVYQHESKRYLLAGYGPSEYLGAPLQKRNFETGIEVAQKLKELL